MSSTRTRRDKVVGWEFMDAETDNLIAYTAEREFRDEWLAEVKAGEWGPTVAVHSVNAEGIAIRRLWPKEGDDER